MIESIKAKLMHHWTEHKWVTVAVAVVVVVLIVKIIT